MTLDTFDGTAPPETGASGELLAGWVARDVLRQQIAALLAHEAGVLRGSDPEELHDMRVASRRIRAALRFFEDVLPENAAAIGKEARWLTNLLGHARDLDVQAERVRRAQHEAAGEEQEGMHCLLDDLLRQSAQAHEDVQQGLGSDQYARLLQALTSLADSEPSPLGSRLAQVAPRLIGRDHRKMRKEGRQLGQRDLPPPEIHRIRIRAKHLRYGVEFCETLYGAPAERYVQRLVRLQDAIGAHHDAYVLVDAVSALVRGPRTPLSPGAAYTLGTFAERLLTEAARREKKLPRLYARTEGSAWRRLKAAFADVAGDH